MILLADASRSFEVKDDHKILVAFQCAAQAGHDEVQGVSEKAPWWNILQNLWRTSLKRSARNVQCACATSFGPCVAIP